MRLLLVEEDTMIGESVPDLLHAERDVVDWVKDGELAETAPRVQPYELARVPQLGGLQVEVRFAWGRNDQYGVSPMMPARSILRWQGG